MTVYGYVRVSTAEQASGGSSLDAQMSQIAGYAMMKGWKSEPIYLIEEAVSGSVPFIERPQGSRLTNVMESGDAIVGSKLDRMFRDVADALATLDRCKKSGVSIHLIDVGGDISDSIVGKMTFTILAAVAEMERARIRERITEVKRDMKARGLHHGGPRPFGFKVVDKHYVPIPEEQAVIARIWQLREVGAGTRRIATVLKREGLASFVPIQVQRILDRTGVLAA